MAHRRLFLWSALLFAAVGIVAGGWALFVRPVAVQVLEPQSNVAVQVFGLGTVEARVVESGRLRLERYTPSGATVVLHTARTGELLAEGALVTDIYHCDAIALEESCVRILRKTAVLANLKPGSPGHVLVAVMARQLLRLRQRIELRNIRSADDRVMQYLEQNADPRGNVLIDRQLQDIAGELGLSREALYRTLSKLQKQRRIKRYPDHISVVRR
jgi:CRP-like cAMP-binding protein